VLGKTAATGVPQQWAQFRVVESSDLEDVAFARNDFIQYGIDESAKSSGVSALLFPVE
jgi:hypothetical protein